MQNPEKTTNGRRSDHRVQTKARSHQKNPSSAEVTRGDIKRGGQRRRGYARGWELTAKHVEEAPRNSTKRREALAANKKCEAVGRADQSGREGQLPPLVVPTNCLGNPTPPLLKKFQMLAETRGSESKKAAKDQKRRQKRQVTKPRWLGGSRLSRRSGQHELSGKEECACKSPNANMQAMSGCLDRGGQRSERRRNHKRSGTIQSGGRGEEVRSLPSTASVHQKDEAP